jgi:DNA invertase Pin-like site-specific DNA recombinase
MIPKAGTVRAALYARVSTVGHGQDVGLQLEELRQVAAQRGWTIVDEYVDRGISGTKESRPALDRMLAEVQAGKLDVIACWKLDRLGRSIQHVLSVLDQITHQGVSFVSVRDAGLDTTTPNGRLLINILAAFASFERDLIQERVLAGVRRAQAAGKHCGRPRVDVDLRPATALLKEGRGLKEVSVILKIPRATLRRRLQEAGAWPASSLGGHQPCIGEPPCGATFPAAERPASIGSTARAWFEGQAPTGAGRPGGDGSGAAAG